MKRWLARAVLGWLFGGGALILALGLLTGCQPTFLAREVYEQAHEGMPKNLEGRPDQMMAPLTEITRSPATVIDAERPPRYLELQEAIAIALENGHASGRAGAGTGRVDNNLVSFAGGSLIPQSERIRVLALNPAISFAAMEGAASRFDPIFITTMNWTGTDGISGVPNLPGNLGTVPGNGADLQVALVKAFATGGVGEIALLTNYRQLSNPAGNPFAFGLLNPQYSTRLSIGFEQPLWRDWGVDINQLLARFPTPLGQAFAGNNIFSAFNSRQNGVSAFVDRQSEGILISRLRFDQQRAEFERQIHTLLVQTEVAYWNLYSKYGQLYSFEENLRIMHRAYQENYNKFKAGNLEPQKYHQVRGQYEEFRAERLRALDEVIAAERELRGILGLKTEDGTRLVPTTPPVLAKFNPDWESSVRDALHLRPELILARDNVKYHDYLLSIQKNNLRPDLRGYARFEPFGNGNTLTGNGSFLDASGTLQPTNAIRSLTHSHLADYQLGINMSVPLGWRQEYAAIRAARLQLTQSYLLLKDQEEKTVRILHGEYAAVAHWYERIKAHRAERTGYRDSLLTLDSLVRSGSSKKTYGDPEFLEAQRRYAAALVKEYQAIAEYNNSLAKLEWAKGTIMRYNNVHISEGALPQCAQTRAVEYQKERTRSLMLRARPDVLRQPGLLAGAKALEPMELDPDDDRAARPHHIVPAKFETKPEVKHEAPRDIVVPASGVAQPPGEETPVKFRPQGAPRTLPKLEALPILEPTTGSLPAAPSVVRAAIGEPSSLDAANLRK
jgi:outer membrane protein TolC